jgi:CHAT domain-containing protein
MAALPRGLCVILTVWLAVSRPQAADRAESPYSSAGWGIPEFTHIAEQAPRLRNGHDYAAMEALYEGGLAHARRIAHGPAEITYLTALANTRILRYKFAGALTAYGEAVRLARESGDWLAAGAIAPGLSSLYDQFGDQAQARAAIEEGLDAVSRLPSRPYYWAQLQLQRARVLSGRARLAPVMEAIEEAREQLLPALEAQAWQLRGETLLDLGDPTAAERSLNEAFRLRLMHEPDGLRHSWYALAKLRLAQARHAAGEARARLLSEAASFNARAMGAARQRGFDLEWRVLLQQRGLIREARGDAPGALEDFAAAVEVGEQWRLAVPAAGGALTAANAKLDAEVFRTFIEAAARHALVTRDQTWALRALRAVEQNRAASLRQTLALAPVWRKKLPEAYWATLGELHAGQMAHGTNSPRTGRLLLELSEMEVAAGVGFSPLPEENFLSGGSLKRFWSGLSREELFLSLHLGVEESYLWSVSDAGIRMYRLPPRDEVERRAGAFVGAVLAGGRGRSNRASAELYRTLFGALSTEELARPAWLLSLEGKLFEAPLAALEVEGGGETVFLVERHSLQVVPSALSLRSRTGEPGGRYLAVGDPIYNTADPRLQPTLRLQPAARLAGSFWRPPAQDRQGGIGPLNRLVGSGAEIESSARVWRELRAARGGRRPAEILMGARAGRQQFLAALSRATPASIHLATHVVTTGQPEKPFLALSVGPAGRPELVGEADIAVTNAEGALVVMTGCASGQGEIRNGAGLLGLTRAWLVAGASTVVATLWPVEDTAGRLVPSFYRHLGSGTAAEALRQAQIEMIHAGTWEATPLYWASYQATGGVR